MHTVTKTVRLPETLAVAVENCGADLGLTFTDVVERALRAHLGLPTDPALDLMAQIRLRLRARYPDLTGFPQDVTLEVFKDIRDLKPLRELYDRALDSGGDAEEALASLHRRIGKGVKLVLKATVVGRSLPLNAEEVLIQTHALLVPSIA